MSKAVLISIRPKWCELIASGKKTIEVRKTRPMLETPFKCYIYCTKTKKGEPFMLQTQDSHDFTCGKTYRATSGGEIIGEFVCDQIEEIAVAFRGGDGPLTARGGNEVWYGGMVEHMSCLSTEAICRYVGGVGGVGYGWHISKLLIYDEPLWLSQMTAEKRGRGFYIRGPITRPPQSWCYVEELT